MNLQCDMAYTNLQIL